MKYEKEIKARLRVSGYTLEDLTAEEIKQLQEEIEIKKKGGIVVDGVLFNKDPFPMPKDNDVEG